MHLPWNDSLVFISYIYLFIYFETEYCFVGQAGLELLTSSDPPNSASQSAGITGLSHRPEIFIMWSSLENVYQPLL